MEQVPNRLKCAYCERHCTHGGECSGKPQSDELGCLLFKHDELGCIRNRDFKIPIALYQEIPPINFWTDGFVINGVDTRIKLKRIYSLGWDRDKGYLIISCNCDYYINDFHEEYIEHQRKPKLSLVK